MTTFTNFFARAGPLATLFLATAMALPLNGGVTPNMLRSSSYSASAHQRKTAMTNYGSFEMIYPAVWNDNDAYVLFEEKTGWRKMNPVEVKHTVRQMPKDEFDHAFPDIPKSPLG